MTSWIRWIWQNDYVNMEWEDFEKKHGEELLPEVLQYLSDIVNTERCGKEYRFSRDGKSTPA